MGELDDNQNIIKSELDEKRKKEMPFAYINLLGSNNYWRQATGVWKAYTYN